MSNARVTRIVRRDNGHAVRRFAQFSLRIHAPNRPVVVQNLATPMCRVGALENNDLILDDPSVSGLHCQVEARETGLLVTDLGSTNGCTLNGIRIEQAYWPEQSSLQVGNVMLELLPAAGETSVATDDSVKLGGLVGQSAVMRELFAQLKRLSTSNGTVLVTGETGTGKEALVETLVSLSERATAPLVVVDCGALSPTLIESQLFGHEKGAFTGATAQQLGAFERAHGGTVFLDEIGELPLELQPKLLRLLERREVLRVGGRAPVSVDVRIVSATHRQLEKEVNAQRFRADLFYRLSVLRITLPPLRDRSEDIPLLVQHFLGDGPQPDESLLKQWMTHPWPGNVRELRNAIERWRYGQPWNADRAAPLPAAAHNAAPQTPSLETPFLDQKEALVSHFESAYAQVLLSQAGQNISAAARLSGLSRMAVVKMLQRLNLYSSLK
jgi:DNA-binding NtrC family response regulator